MWFKRAWSN